MKTQINRILPPVLPLALLSLTWLSFVYADVKLGRTFSAVDSPAVRFGVILLTAAAVWILARKAFCPEDSGGEIKILFASLAGTAMWLFFTVLIVIQFHVWLGGSL